MHPHLDRFQAQNLRWQALVAPLSSEQAHWKPHPKAWSVAEVAEHLIQVGRPYLTRLAAARADRAAPESARAYRASLAGGLLVRAVQPGTRAVPAPAAFRPAADGVSGDVFESLRDVHAALEEEMARWDGLDWNRPTFGSPITGLIRVKPGDAISILAGHTERHVDQMARVLASDAFPG